MVASSSESHSRTELSWKSRRKALQLLNSREDKEKEDTDGRIDNTLEVKVSSVSDRSLEMQDVSELFRDLGKTFDEIKTIFDETDNRVKSIYKRDVSDVIDEPVEEASSERHEDDDSMDEDEPSSEAMPRSSASPPVHPKVSPKKKLQHLPGISLSKSTGGASETTPEVHPKTQEVQTDISEAQAATPKLQAVISEAKLDAQETNPEAKTKVSPGWDESDPTVPEGWKTRVFSNGPNKTMKKLMDPSGVIIQTRKEALQRMLVSNVYSQEDVNHMKSHLNSQSKNKIYRNVTKEDPKQEVARAETPNNRIVSSVPKREIKQEVIKEESPKDEDEMMQEAEEWGKEIDEKVGNIERYIEKELKKKDSKKEQKELIEDMLNKDKVEDEKRAGGESLEKDWISSEAEFLLPSGWSYRWHFVRRASSRTGLKRSLHFQTDLGFKLKSSNEAFKYMVENDFPEEDQEKLKAFVSSSRIEEKRRIDAEVRKEPAEKEEAEVKKEPAEQVEAQDNLEETREMGDSEASEVCREGVAETEQVSDPVETHLERRNRQKRESRRRVLAARRSQGGLEDHQDEEGPDPKSGSFSHIEDVQRVKHHEDDAAEKESKFVDEGEPKKEKESKYAPDPTLPEGWRSATYTLTRNGRPCIR